MAKLLEYQGKQILSKAGINMPKGKILRREDSLDSILQETKFPLVLKAQVLTGERGKMGAIRRVGSAEELKTACGELFETKVNGLIVDAILAEEWINVSKEYYLSVVTDIRERCPRLIFCLEGGINIEEIAKDDPEKILTFIHPVLKPLQEYMVINQLRKFKALPNSDLIPLSQIMTKLYHGYRRYDCRLAEINPLARSEKGFIALDARFEIDDDAIFRQKELGIEVHEEVGCRAPTPMEIAAAQIDAKSHKGSVHFVQIDPDGSYVKEINKIPIGFNCVGTGASLTTLDELVPLGYYPVNFCDSSGNPPADKLYEITKIIFSQPGIQGYLFCSCVSSQQLDETAKGIIQGMNEMFPETGGKPNIPAVFCLRGAYEDEARRLFEKSGILDVPWTRFLGREASEQDAVEAFDRCFKQWQSSTQMKKK